MIQAPWKDIVVLGLAGRAQTGKDTIASYLVNTHVGVRKQGFSWALKAHCHIAFEMIDKDPDLLQRLGTAYRDRNPNFWIDVLCYMIHNDPPAMLIIPDVRFGNEAAFVRRVGGYLVHLRRCHTDGTPYVSPDRLSDHPSEQETDDIQGHEAYTVTSGDLIQLQDIAELSYNQAIDHHERFFTPASPPV